MKHHTRWVRWLPLTIFLVLAGFLWRGLSLDPHHLPAPGIGKVLPYFELPRLDHARNIHSSDLKGEYWLLNVWASWCDSCVDEQAFLMKLSHSGIHLVGINYKDHEENANNWLVTWGNPYQKIGVDPTGQTVMALGVYGTPETFLVSPQGKLLYRHAGVMTRAVWESEFLPRMGKVGGNDEV